MTITLAELNALPAAEAAERFRACCGSSRWVERMTASRPFPGRDALLARAREIWRETGPADWEEAFAHHPRIGERRAAAAVARTASAWSAEEQRAAGGSAEEDRRALADLMRVYEERFARIYLVCATGLTARDMMDDIRRRLEHDPDTERRIAAGEQEKITALRLERLVTRDP